jgi:hypothetical protein
LSARTRLALIANYNANDTFRVYVTARGDGTTWAMDDRELLTLQTTFVLADLRVSIALGSTTATVGDVVFETRAAWCRSVTCPAQRCFNATTCVDGSCLRSPLPLGTACDDGAVVTTNDVCDGAGQCAGTDPCDGVVCPAPDSCHVNTTCSGGLCFAGAARSDGTSCDDGNAATTADMCSSGVCRGTATPATTTAAPVTAAPNCGQGSGPGGCPLPDACHQPLTCSQGVCFIGGPLNDSTPCDDLNAGTINDVCTNGVCAGVDPCTGVTCAPTLGQCQVNGTCAAGQCGYTTVPDGGACDDGDNTTVGDGCFAGLCVGVNPCLDNFGQPVMCQPSGDICTVAGTCFPARERGLWRGVCTNPLAQIGATCSDTNPDTVNETCTQEGRCRGTDLCAGVVCPPIDDCHGPGTCALGLCADGPSLQANTSCDDGNNRTVNDICDGAGTCTGTDPCDAVTCPSTQCHASPTCLLGVCSRGQQLGNFAPCDDNVRSPPRHQSLPVSCRSCV